MPLPTSYIVDQAFPAELGVQMEPGQNWPGPIHFNNAVYRVCIKENLESVSVDTTSTIAIYKTVDGGLTSTELDAANEVFVKFLGNAFNQAVAYYPPEGGSLIYCAYQSPSNPDNELRGIVFDLSTETWGVAITGSGEAVDASTTKVLSLTVRTTGEWIIFFTRSTTRYITYSGGVWSASSILASGSSFNQLFESGRDASDNVVFYGQSSVVNPGPLQARALSSSNVLGPIVSIGLTFNTNQDNWCKPVYVPGTNQMVLAIAELGGINGLPGGIIHCVKSAPDATGFSLEIIQGAYTTNFDNGLGPASPFNISPLSGEQGQAWPRIVLSPDGLSLYCYYNLNDNSVTGIDVNSIIRKTQTVGGSTWGADITLFDTNTATLVPDIHASFGNPTGPVPCYRMAVTIFSDGTQVFGYGTIAQQPVAPPPERVVDDFGNAQFQVSIGAPAPPPVVRNKPQGGRRRFPIQVNAFDLCMFRDYSKYLCIDPQYFACARKPLCFCQDERDWGGNWGEAEEIILGPPRGAIAFNPSSAIALPAPVDGDQVVMQFVVPKGYDGIILGQYQEYRNPTGNPSTFIEGSGDIFWRLSISKRYARDCGAMTVSLGSAQALSPVAGGLQLRPGNVVQYIVNVPNTTGSLSPGVGTIAAGLHGYFFPRR